LAAIFVGVVGGCEAPGAMIGLEEGCLLVLVLSLGCREMIGGA
jgi:hypothetical protein